MKALRDEMLAAGIAGATTGAVERIAIARDASHYLLRPRLVARPETAQQVADALRLSGRHGAAVTFRSGGTSLSGQASTDQVLLDTRRHFRKIEVHDEGARVTVEPGATLRQVNARLARHGRRLGPDPASEIACTIGGVIANNASGMTCGTTQNAYATIESAIVVLPSGTIIDTAAEGALDRLHDLEPGLYTGLCALRDGLRSDPATVDQITRAFAIKNTMGYGLNSFVDHDSVLDILLHLLVGSEGTLGFVARATFRTVKVKPHLATGLLLLDDLDEAVALLPRLVESGPSAVELMDARSLAVAQTFPAVPGVVRDLDVVRHAALLVEYGADSEDELRHLGIPLVGGAERAALWKMRKDLYATVAGARAQGTTALLEDIAVPMDRLGTACSALQDLFATHGYQDSVVFGHAKDGNLHFMLNESFSDGVPRRYERFTEELVDLVLSLGGTLKAEHGTGRMMTPFVERQYGPGLYEAMRTVKHLFDPARVLNPGIIVGDDPGIHLRSIKPSADADPIVGKCVDCGFCEPVCPSQDLTVTPRQRIALHRDLSRGDRALARYQLVDTCAVDGMCGVACPVGINTGDLVKELRAQDAGRATSLFWRLAARHWRGFVTLARVALSVSTRLPRSALLAVNRVARRAFGAANVPLWSPDLPRGGRSRRTGRAAGEADAVFFPSCTNSIFGPAEGVSNAFRALCERAGVILDTPSKIDSLCCATPWSSKGLTSGHESMTARLQHVLNDRDKPIVVDATSCTEGLKRVLGDAPVVDVLQFTRDVLVPRLKIDRRFRSMVVHPTCSSTRLGLDPTLLDLCSLVADEVTVPDEWRCCGFAGDRGLLFPELTASASRREAEAANFLDAEVYVSTNRTCEIGMSRATGRNYVHVVELLESCTREET
ncbi:FAD-binding and (Fe-S)-binding domain-containing protein [Herbidospora sp. RD11066]